MLSYNTFRPGGHWEYEMFTEVITSTRYPEKKSFALIDPDAPPHMGRIQDYDSRLARLIDKAARNLLQRISAQGWEPVDAIDTDSLWAKGRVRFKDGAGFKAIADDTREIEPTTVSIFCRRLIQQSSSVVEELSNESNPAPKHVEIW